ncbi:unnamed protein product [Dibothriocephalus latus]|uniref:Uncharacterized protein n=1 Tax=Dibothriocephalus latus TaxID=60516 RepID=A0A3P7R0Q9_DIBLA|nr:unnamed protein product [Dibothriocephalus latus]
MSDFVRNHYIFTITSADEDVSTKPTLKKHLKAKVKARLSDLDLESDHMSLSTPSTSVPSVAHVRYSVASTDSGQFDPFPEFWIADYLQTQRILLYQQEHPKPRIFYFCDYLGCGSCQSRREPVYFGNEKDIETTGSRQSTCQSSSFLTWITYSYGFSIDRGSSSSSHTPLSCISALFKDAKDAKDAFELFPNCGNYVLCALFAEPRSKPKPLEEDPLAGSVTLEDFFNLNCEFECVAHPDDSHQWVLEEDEEEDEETAEEAESISGESLSGRIGGSSDCEGYYDEAVGKLQKLKPAEWIFFQTRWPPLLAPQQVLDLEKNYPAHIPLWRGSTVRLVRDVVRFCRQHPKSDCLLLLDPLVSKFFVQNVVLLFKHMFYAHLNWLALVRCW